MALGDKAKDVLETDRDDNRERLDRNEGGDQYWLSQLNEALRDLEELQEELRQEQERNRNNVGLADLERAELLGALTTIAGGLLPDGDHVNLPAMVFAEDILKTHRGE